jgi:hypothetical protein
VRAPRLLDLVPQSHDQRCGAVSRPSHRFVSIAKELYLIIRTNPNNSSHQSQELSRAHSISQNPTVHKPIRVNSL